MNETDSVSMSEVRVAIGHLTPEDQTSILAVLEMLLRNKREQAITEARRQHEIELRKLSQDD